jgi:hypothetical protein
MVRRYAFTSSDMFEYQEKAPTLSFRSQALATRPLGCGRSRAQVPDGRQLARLLRARRQRPRRRRAAERG